MSEEETKVFLDISIGINDVGRMVFQLHDDIVPETVNNFVELCRGECTSSVKKNTKIWYKNSIFHYLIKNSIVKGGDFENHDGTGGESIYGSSFDDESFVLKHSARGVIAMDNDGPNSNNSRFYISFKSLSHLDGKYVVFGRLVKGFEVLDVIERVETDEIHRPIQEIRIRDCGLYSETESSGPALQPTSLLPSVSEDEVPMPSLETSLKPTLHNNEPEQNTFNNRDISEGDKLVDSKDKKETYSETSKITSGDVGLGVDYQFSDEDDDESEPEAALVSAPISSIQQRLAKLKSGMRSDLRENKRAAKDEYNKLSLGIKPGSGDNHRGSGGAKETKGGKRKRKDDLVKAVAVMPNQNNLDFLGAHANTNLLIGVSGDENDQYRLQQETKQANLLKTGHYVHTDDARFETHSKKMSLTVVANTNELSTTLNGNDVTMAQRRQISDQVTHQQTHGKDKFSKRRKFDKDENMIYVDEKNRQSNKRLEKEYGAYSNDIKGALSRGSAL